MRNTILPALLLVAAAFAGGCVGEGQVVYSDGYASSGPDLVEVSPGVQVIADYNEPIFFTDGLYWRWYNNGWYRSSYYTGGWGYVGYAPEHLRGIDRPAQYAHYRPSGWSPSHNHATPVERPPVRATNAPVRGTQPVARPPLVAHDNTREPNRVQTPVRATTSAHSAPARSTPTRKH